MRMPLLLEAQLAKVLVLPHPRAASLALLAPAMGIALAKMKSFETCASPHRRIPQLFQKRWQAAAQQLRQLVELSLDRCRGSYSARCL